jgi:hypothetical protein
MILIQVDWKILISDELCFTLDLIETQLNSSNVRTL